MPVPSNLSDAVVRAILKAIQEEDENNTFLHICNRDINNLGALGSDKRRLCQYKRRNFLRLAKNKPEAYLALLADYNSREIPTDLPSRMTPVALNRRRGKSHSDQNKNDVDLDYESGMGKFVFVAHLVFSFISFDKLLTFFLFCRGRGGRRRSDLKEDPEDSTKEYADQPPLIDWRPLINCSQAERVLH
jgi:hypothetical protein